MMQVLTQTFVYSFLTGFVVYAFWLYVTYKTIDTLIRLVEPVRPTQTRGVKHLD